MNDVRVLLWQTGLKKAKKLLTKANFCGIYSKNSGTMATSPITSPVHIIMSIFQAVKQLYRQTLPLDFRFFMQKARGTKVYHDYNYKYKCIFIHIPKTAGTSLQESLFSFSRTGHFRYIDYKLKDPEAYKNFFKFCVVRNPYERIYSAFNFLKKGGKTHGDKLWADYNLKSYDSFDSFVKGWLRGKNIFSWFHFYPQYLFVEDPSSGLQVDFVAKMDTLVNDFNLISTKLGLSGKKLLHVNASNNDKKEVNISADSKEIIYKLYKRDFEIFEYDK